MSSEGDQTEAETLSNSDASTQTGHGAPAPNVRSPLGESSKLAQVLGALGEIDEGIELGNYRIERAIGRGGMGEVFIARHLETDEVVALKWLGRAHPSALHRFKREFRALADVKHENLVALGELVVLEGSRAFFTMELLDGRHFNKYVRGSTPVGKLPNLVRLKRALRQLVTGVCHLHTLDYVHRDLKPSNVLVTSQGRVVILDFGLISEIDSNEMSLSPSGALVGTPSFIAPEHAARQRAGKPADLYAVGVMLYQCLTGQLPFSGSPAVVLMAKQDRDAPLVSEAVPDAPPELVAMCKRLLERDPDVRPTAPELLAQIDGESALPQAVNMSHASMRAIMPSRERLHNKLNDALTGVATEPVTVHLRHGPGIGKTMLLDRFCDALREQEDAGLRVGAPPLLLLRGRCHERESVPYKGMDQIVDSLTLQLCNMSENEAGALEPSSVAPLLQMFPVLSSVWPPDSTLFGVDKNELRSFGLASLREVLVRAGQRYTVVVCIEDFHWADMDGARILSELVRPPEAPRMLLIVTYVERLGGEVLEFLKQPERLHGRNIRELELGPMSDDEARKIAREYLGSAFDELPPSEQETRLGVYLERANGDPFFLSQLIAEDLIGGSDEVSLEGIVLRRVFSLTAEQRRVLALVSACDGPCSATLLAACSADTNVDADIEALLKTKLLNRLNAKQFEVTHEKIREATLSELEVSELTSLHKVLAEQLRQSADGRFESIARHYEQAGDRREAVEFYEKAGDQAAAAFAFRRAAEFYQRALEQLPLPRDPKRERDLQKDLAEQLINAGKTREAIEILLRLAEAAGPDEVRRYRRRAAELYIRAGRVSEGLEQVASVLRQHGEHVPGSRTSSLLTLLWRRLVLFVRGKRYVVRQADTIPAAVIEHLDTLLGVFTGLTHQETLLAAMFHARYFRLALDVGEPSRLSRGFTYEAVLQVSRGNDERSRALIATARELVAQGDIPEYGAVVDYSASVCTTLRHEWQQAAHEWPKLIEGLEGVPGAQYVRVIAASRHAYTLATLGDFKQLERESPKWLLLSHELGHEREDSILAAMAALASFVRERDNDDRGTALLVERARRWAAPGYTMPSFHLDLLTIPRMNCMGEVDQAIAAAELAVQQAKQWRLQMFEIVRFNLVELRARTYATAVVLDPGRRGEFVARIRADLKTLRRGRRPMYTGQAAVIDATICAVEGRLDAARVHWDAAVEAFERAGMRGHIAAVRMRQAAAIGGEQGAALRAEAEAYMAEQGITASERLAMMFAPAPDR